ncbi:hypothetical protein RRG08_051593 [Elysia crispata]|uniref:Uncharacterized protein n=1 Tax=Elysia crispata TaxID=231223 RepID=A0AAE1A2X6_9GAST|nr:hypothetical protein RRG08_051593 [Elysia crispata]
MTNKERLAVNIVERDMLKKFLHKPSAVLYRRVYNCPLGPADETKLISTDSLRPVHTMHGVHVQMRQNSSPQILFDPYPQCMAFMYRWDRTHLHRFTSTRTHNAWRSRTDETKLISTDSLRPAHTMHGVHVQMRQNSSPQVHFDPHTQCMAFMYR